MTGFALYPTECHWWSMADYGAVVDAVHGLQAKRVLEFGPGSSTLALIEGGATHIDSCEDDPDWSNTHRMRIGLTYPNQVTIHDYTWSDPLHIASVGGRRYDLALIDGPKELAKRRSVIVYALERSTRVLVPCEDSEGPMMRDIVESIATASGRYVGYRSTGPLAGTFALIGPSCL